MPNFSQRSLKHLHTCDKQLQDIFNEIIKTYDCTIICGFRTEEEQNDLFARGLTKLQWPNSKHNIYPSKAVDVAPYPIDWNDLRRFYHFGGYVRAVADKMGIKIRQGFDWNNNFNFDDQSFIDAPHVELIGD